MIKHVNEVTILDERPTSTRALFRIEDLNALCTQPGATGRMLVRFRHTDGIEYDAAVGSNSSGPLLGIHNLVALPCPPICPGGKFSFNPDC